VDEVGFDGGSLVVAAHDTPNPRVPGIWADEPVSPGLLRYRTITQAGTASAWQTAFDFRSEQLAPDRFTQVYTPRTRPNKPRRPGQYCFRLQQARVTDGAIVEVAVTDTAGNSTFYAAIAVSDEAV